MSIITTLFKPFINKAKKDLSDIVLAFIESRKKADEDGDGQADFEQLKSDAGMVIEGLKLIAAGGTRIAALLMCYYLKYNPAQKIEALQAVSKAGQKVALLTQVEDVA